MSLRGGLGQSDKQDSVMLQRNRRKVAGGVGTGSFVFLNISILCVKFAIQLVPFSSGQSNVFNAPTFYFVLMAPLFTAKLIRGCSDGELTAWR